MTVKKDAPIIKAVLNKSKDKGSSVMYWEIICPYCKEKHTHGAGLIHSSNPITFLGHRVAHCSSDTENIGYILSI